MKRKIRIDFRGGDHWQRIQESSSVRSLTTSRTSFVKANAVAHSAAVDGQYSLMKTHTRAMKHCPSMSAKRYCHI